MKQSAVLKSPEDALKNMQDAYGDLQLKGISDAEVVKMSIMTTSDELVNALSFLETLKNYPGANLEDIANQMTDLMSILKHKIQLTKKAYGINGNYATIIPNPQIQIPFEGSEVKESENIGDSPEQIMARTEKKDNVISFDKAKQELEKKNKKKNQEVKKEVSTRPIENNEKGSLGKFEENGKITVLTSNSTTHGEKNKVGVSFSTFFNGYNRKVIFGTEESIPESVFHLVPLAQTESEIDTIARHLIEEDQVELALNLSIDLFEKSKTAFKLQQEVEKRFLFEILPWAHGVQVDPKTDMQNITLAIWNDQLKQKALSELKPEETVVDQPIDIASIKAKLIADLTKNGKPDGLARGFLESLRHLPMAERRVIWTECLDTWKASVQTAAEQGAETTEQVVELTKDQAKEEVKSIIKKAIEAGENVKNKFQQIIHKKTFRTALGVTKDNVNKIFEEAKSEVIKDNPDLQKKNEDKPRKMVLSNFKVEEMFPTVYESAKNCKNLGEFKDLLINIVFEQKKFPYELKGKTKEMDGWQVAANLVNQYANNFEGSKDWDADTKTGWFNGLIGAVTEQRRKAADAARKEAAKDAIVEDAVIVEESTEQGNVQDSVEQNSTTSETEDSTPKVEPTESTKQEEVELARAEQSSEVVDMKKFDGIMQLSDRNKIDALITEFLLLTSYKTYQERFNELRDKYLKGNKKWSGSKPEQRENTINKIVNNNPEIQKLTK